MRATDFITEIERLRPDDYEGGKGYLNGTDSGKKVSVLPGGSGLLYSVGGGNWGGTSIKIWDPNGKDFIQAKQRGAEPRPVIQRHEDNWRFHNRVRDWEREQRKLKAPGQLIGELTVEKAKSFPLKNAVKVGTITVDEDYRGIGLAKALYGIVLTILKLPLLAGTSQTPGGRKNWVSIAGIPGVEMKGYVSLHELDLHTAKTKPNDAEWTKRFNKKQNIRTEQNIDTIMGQLGGQYIGKGSLGGQYFAFDVKPNSTGKELESAVKTKLSTVYTSIDTDYYSGLYAVWSGK